jgi:ubiquinone/menaquinone biosynthesis C-methylase UbiE
MSLEARLSALEPAVREARRELGIPSEARLGDLVRTRLGEEGFKADPGRMTVTPASLARLYELRARHLDWTYETGYLGFFAPNPGTRYSFRRRLEEQLDLLPSHPAGTLLEVGCGAGILSVLAAPRFARVVGTDVSRTAIAFARRFAEAAGAANVTFAVAEAERLPFPDGAFSAAVCGEVIGHVADPRGAASELGRVTGAGATLVLSTPCAFSFTRAALGMAALFRPGLQGHREEQVDRRIGSILRETGEEVSPEKLLRLKKHFRYGRLVELMGSTGMRLRDARGAALDLPPAALIYPMLPPWGLKGLRGMERALNRIGLLPRFFSISTIFQFEKPLG